MAWGAQAIALAAGWRKVMGAVMAEVKGRADGAAVNRLVRAALGG